MSVDCLLMDTTRSVSEKERKALSLGFSVKKSHKPLSLGRLHKGLCPRRRSKKVYLQEYDTEKVSGKIAGALISRKISEGFLREDSNVYYLGGQ